MSFFTELKRRNAYRVAAIYVISGWVVLQVVDVFMSFMPLPEWTSRLVFVLLAAGLPIALVLAWAIELTADGIKLEASVSGKTGPRHQLGDLLIYGAVGIVLAIWVWKLDLWHQSPNAEPGHIGSLVVLPLDNLMNDPGQAYFVAGMHEVLIKELSKIKALRVISRTSAMKYLDSNKSIAEIGQELSVAGGRPLLSRLRHGRGRTGCQSGVGAESFARSRAATLLLAAGRGGAIRTSAAAGEKSD